MSELRSHQCPHCEAWVISGESHHCPVLKARAAKLEGWMGKLGPLMLLVGLMGIGGSYWPGTRPAAPAQQIAPRPSDTPLKEAPDDYRLLKKWGMFGFVFVAGFCFIPLLIAKPLEALPFSDFQRGLVLLLVPTVCLMCAAIWWHYCLFLPH